MVIHNRQLIYLLGALSGIALIIKLIPLVRFGPFAFGHDSGFYRRYLIEPIVSFPNTPVPGLDHTIFVPRIVLDIVRFLIRQPDIALYGTYLFFSIVGIFCVWYFASHYLSKKATLYAVSLYILSGIQFIAYGNFFFKETVALPLFLLTLLCLEKERYGWATILGILVVLTHQTTSIMLICIGGIGFICKVIVDRTIPIKYIFSGTAILASYLFLHPHIAQKIASPPVGIFLAQTEYLLWSIPLMLLALLGIRRFYTLAKHNPILIAALIVPFAFAALHLPFYNRIYAFMDLFLIIPASLGIEIIADFISVYAKTLLIPALCGVLIAISVPLIYLEITKTPLLDPAIQEALTSLSSLPEGSAVITSPTLLPWVRGWSLASVYAPGNLKEPHLMSDWEQYWAHQNPQFEKGFLATFPRPLYVFVRPTEIQYRPDCAIQVNLYLFSLDSCK